MGDKIYDGIAIVNLVGALSETIAFLVDGKQFTGSRQINYISNSICFIGTKSRSGDISLAGRSNYGFM